MTRIWITAALMGLSVAGAWLLVPGRLAMGAQGIDLETIVPETIGEWRLDDSIRPVLPRKEDEGDGSLVTRIYDQTLVRTYRNPDGDQVMLVIAYGRDQSDALQLHLPEVCYASQGFAVNRAGRGMIDLGYGAGLPVTHLLTRRGRRHEPVTYWTRVGDTISLSMLRRQWAKLSFGLRGRVPDGVLIRVSTISSRSKRAFTLQERFLREMILNIDPAKRSFFLGTYSF